MTTVAIVMAPEAPSVYRMFLAAGYEGFFVNSPEDFDTLPFDMVCFVGGEDVSPELYREENTSSYCNPKRDKKETDIYNAIPKDIPKVGICRGGQFLNIMNGGKMIQHIEGHTSTIHTIFDRDSREIILVNSDHHQAMIEAKLSNIISLSKDTEEVLWYPDTKSLCFQPHPEWGHKPTHDYFFELLERYGI